MVDDSEQNVLKFTDGEEGSMSFITLDKKVKAHVKKQFKHMAGDFWTGSPDKVTKGTVNRRSRRYANVIYELLEKRGHRSKSRFAVPENSRRCSPQSSFDCYPLAASFASEPTS